MLQLDILNEGEMIMEYLKEGYLGAIAAKLIIENKEEIVRMTERGKKSETIKEVLQYCHENINIIEEFYGSNFDNVMQGIVTISKYYKTETYRPEFLLNNSAQYIKQSAIDIVFNEFFTEGITTDKLKNFVEKFSDDEYDRMLFLEYMEDLEI